MSQFAISAEHLSKQYAIGQVHDTHPTLRGYLSQALRSPLERFRNVLRGRRAEVRQQSFWALKDVSFEVEQGSVLGVIGRNGSGKSTLLKILSRITDPTEGKALLYGRVGSLLEVGTGFHPDLSGRDNIFLNGAMLGMRRAEIRRRFDDIIAFSEVARFLDTPIKHYSSGMHMRLAFAVAAHLEPEILIVDEVLAVGDPSFQAKCLAKLEEVSRTGRTVLVVSHALPIIQSKCRQCIWLDKGQLVRAGKTDDVIVEYAKSMDQLRSLPLQERPDRDGSGKIRFLSVHFQDTHGNERCSLLSGEPVAIVVRVGNTTQAKLDNVDFSIRIEDASGTCVTYLSSHAVDEQPRRVEPGEQTVTFQVARWPLTAGRYSYTLSSRVNNELADMVRHAGNIQVEAGNFYGTGKPLPGHGLFNLDFTLSQGSRAA